MLLSTSHTFPWILKLLILFANVNIRLIEALCYKQWYLDTMHPAPTKCPEENLFTYYDCCNNSNQCCPYLKWPILVCFGIIGLGIIVGCCCICLAGLSQSIQRQRQRPSSPETLPSESSVHNRCSALDLSSTASPMQDTLRRAHEINSAHFEIRE